MNSRKLKKSKSDDSNVKKKLVAHRKVALTPEAEVTLAVHDGALERARTQWQFGDWQALAQLDRDTLETHPDRAKLALFSAAGHLQIDNNTSEAAQLIRLAQDWGCSEDLIARILVAGVRNSLGRATAVADHPSRAFEHFKNAIAIGAPEMDMRLVVKARADEQLSQLGQPHSSQGLKNGIREKALARVTKGGKEDMTLLAASLVGASRPVPSGKSEISETFEKNYYIKSNYKSRLGYTHYDDMDAEDKWQLEIYLYAYAYMKKHNFKTVADIGCGSAYKLMTYLGEFETIGFELTDNVKRLKKRYPERDWRISSFESSQDACVDVIICSDVIEHLENPDLLINYILQQDFQILVLSTPERDLVRSKDDLGPPKNKAHVREWNYHEFFLYIQSKFEIIDHLVTNVTQGTQMIVCRKK